jgi:hypothetical protein
MSENSNNSLIKHFSSRLEWEMSRFLDLFPLTPKDFSWKVRWRMRYDRNPLFVEIQDKYRVKEYAHKIGVHTADVYYVTSDPETIPFGSLPEKYFIKANHGCGWNILYENGKYYNYKSGENLINRDLSKEEVTRDECVELCQFWLNSIYSKHQWSYSKIQPLIMVEEKLEPRVGTALVDYRCFVFDGVVDLPNHYEKPPIPFPPKDPKFSEIIRIAELLGRGIDFVRVDLFDTVKGIVLGEMTIYPEGGGKNTPTADKKFNTWLGNQWNLPSI